MPLVENSIFFLTVSRCKSKASSSKLTEEQLNYLKVCLIATDELAEGLREIFKREWDNRYKATLGEWKDEPENGMEFWYAESLPKRKENFNLRKTIFNGNRAEWDCTTLFYVILSSDCIHNLDPVVRSNVDDLRKFPNEELSHMPRGCVSSRDFQNVVSKISTVFHALDLPTKNIREIANKTTFQTEELAKVLTKIDIFEQKFPEQK